MGSLFLALKHHSVALAIIAVAAIAGQVATLNQPSLVSLTPRALLDIQPFSRLSSRLPIVVAQVVLILCTLFECYVLVYRITRQRWVTALPVSLICINLYFLSVDCHDWAAGSSDRLLRTLAR